VDYGRPRLEQLIGGVRDVRYGCGDPDRRIRVGYVRADFPGITWFRCSCCRWSRTASARHSRCIANSTGDTADRMTNGSPCSGRVAQRARMPADKLVTAQSGTGSAFLGDWRPLGLRNLAVFAKRPVRPGDLGGLSDRRGLTRINTASQTIIAIRPESTIAYHTGKASAFSTASVLTALSRGRLDLVAAVRAQRQYHVRIRNPTGEN